VQRVEAVLDRGRSDRSVAGNRATCAPWVRATGYGYGLVERARSFARGRARGVRRRRSGKPRCHCVARRPPSAGRVYADPTSHPGTIASYARMDLADLAAVVRLVDDAKVIVRVAATRPLDQAADAAIS